MSEELRKVGDTVRQLVSLPGTRNRVHSYTPRCKLGGSGCKSTIRDKRCRVADAGHEAHHHCPGQTGPLDSGRLVYYRTDALRFHNTPCQEHYGSDGHDDHLHDEEMAAVRVGIHQRGSFRRKNGAHMEWIGNQIKGREMSQKRKKHIKSRVVVPEDAGNELATGELRCLPPMKWYVHERMLFTLGHIARNMTKTQVPPMLDWTPYHMLKVVGDGGDECSAVIMDVPCHCASIKDAPQTPKDAETRAINDGECNMEHSTWTRVQNEERCDQAVSQPHTDPGLPPRHA